jgi:hypothetical protein
VTALLRITPCGLATRIARPCRGIRRPGALLAFWLLVAWLASSPGAGAASIATTLDRSVLPVGETATLTVTVENATPRSQPAFSLPDGLRLTPGGRSRSVTVINGRQTVQIAMSFVLEASQEGNFLIPAAEVQTDAGVLRTQPLSVRVTKANPVNASIANAQAFLQIAPQKNRVYMGEVLPVELHLYVEEGRMLPGLQFNSDGFNVGKFGDSPSQNRTRVGNRVMTLVTFRTVATPVKTGSLRLGPVILPMEVPVPGSRGDFFGFRPSQNLRVTAEAVTVEVLPLPAGAPADFTGAVGQFTMEYNAGPTTLGVGDPVTLKIAITGAGALENVSLPPLSHWKGFKFYPPNTTTEASDPFETSGRKLFEQVVVPQSPELASLPAFTWTYFDAEAGSYRTLRGESVPLKISAAAPPTLATPTLATNASGNAAGGGNNGTPALLHIRPQLGSVITLPAPLWERPWFLGLQAAPLLAWAALRLRRWRTESLGRNPRLLRQREAQRQVEAGMKSLRQCAETGRTEPFFATLTRVLRCQIGERLDLPESSLTEGVIQERLVPRGLGPEDAALLEELFQQHNQYRYAAQGGAAHLAGLVPKVEQALAALRALPPTP